MNNTGSTLTAVRAGPHRAPPPMTAAPPPKSTGRVWRLLPLIGLALLVLVVSRLDLAGLRGALSSLGPGAVAAAGLSFLANVLLKAVRWRRMLAAQSLVVPLWECVAAFLTSAFYGSVTIGRVGELSRVQVLLRRGVSLGSGISSCLFDRLLDLMLVVSVGGLAGAVWLGRPELLAAAVVVLGLGLVLTLVFARRGVAAARRMDAPPAGRFARTLYELALGSAPLLRPRPLAEAVAWTVVAWLGYFGAAWILALGMGLEVSAGAVITATATGTLTSLLPITFQGLGTREVVFAVALGREGIAPEVAVALGLCLFAVFLVVTLVSGAVGLWMERHVRA